MGLASLKALMRIARGGGMRADILIIATASLPVGLAALLRDSVMARTFGAGDAVDAYVLPAAVILFLVNIMGGAIGPALIPLLARLRAEGRADAALAVCGGIWLRLMLGLAALSALLFALAPGLISMLAPNFPEAKRELSGHLLSAVLPALFFGGLAAFLAALLQSRRRFLLTVLAQATPPLTMVLAVWLWAGRIDIYAMAAGMTAGTLIQCLVLAIGLKDEARLLRPRWHAPRPEMRTTWRQYAPMLLGAALMGGTLLVDQVMAAWLDAGSVAALAFGGVLVNYVVIAGIQVFSTPALPHFAELVARRDWQGARRFLGQTVAVALALGMAVALAIIALSGWLVDLLFHHGAFTAADAQRVARVQQFYALQLPWHIAGVIFARLLSALGMNHVLMLAAALNLAANVVLNYILMSFMGVAGIALATSLVYLFSFIFCGVVALHRLATNEHGNG